MEVHTPDDLMYVWLVSHKQFEISCVYINIIYIMYFSTYQNSVLINVLYNCSFTVVTSPYQCYIY